MWPWETMAQSLDARDAEVARLTSNLTLARGMITELSRRLSATESDQVSADPVHDRVEGVIGDLSAGNVSDLDRSRLRGAVDTAHKLLVGREGADHALNQALGKTMKPGFRTII